MRPVLGRRVADDALLRLGEMRGRLAEVHGQHLAVAHHLLAVHIDVLHRAIAGGVAGSKIQKRVQQGNTETVTEKRCETVYDTKEKIVGWDVRYRIGEQVQTVRMDSDPGVGAQLPLRNGRLTAQTDAKGRGTT